MLGFMDLGWPRVCRRSASVLLNISAVLKFAYLMPVKPENPQGLCHFGRFSLRSVAGIINSLMPKEHFTKV